MEKYPFIACIVSCRSEYVRYVITDQFKDKIGHIGIRGFESPEEQEEASRIYLDKRGIIRPATPWLNPEFTNPLFLRSAVQALQNKGEKEFPKGINGFSKLFSFFIEATGQNLTSHYGGSDDLIKPLLTALNAIAQSMVDTQDDFLKEGDAVKIIDNAFQNFTKPDNENWLETLIRNGLLQKYPAYSKNPDPLNPPDDDIRFSFERLKDHLMAKKLLEDLDDLSDVFHENGRLGFILKNKMVWYWSGLISALSIAVPEKYGIELYDCLPEKTDYHTASIFLRGFEESVKWRDKDAFSHRTRELLPILDKVHINSLTLVLEMSLSENHPFNAINLLSPALKKRQMAERDAFWSYKLCHEGNDDNYSIERIVDWSFDGASNLTETDALKCAALVLTWTFSTSNRVLRDRATKGLISLFLIDHTLFKFLAEYFKDIDDLYISVYTL